MDPELPAKITIELSTAGRKARKLFDGLVRKRGLTLARARALLLLSMHGGWNQSELAEALEIEQPSVVRLLDGLERQGLIVRAAVEGDRRAKHVKLTPLATQQVRELDELSAAVRAVLLQGIDAEEMKTTLSVLRRIINNAESASPELGELDVRAR